jgi:hypothetical protein
MNISALNVTFEDDAFSVELSGGRTIRVPIVWFPRLLHATVEQRAQYQLSSRGIHWEAIDEDVSIEGLLAGCGDVTKSMAANVDAAPLSMCPPN